jgi:hypothetical protein
MNNAANTRNELAAAKAATVGNVTAWRTAVLMIIIRDLFAAAAGKAGTVEWYQDNNTIPYTSAGFVCGDERTADYVEKWATKFLECSNDGHRAAKLGMGLKPIRISPTEVRIHLFV